MPDCRMAAGGEWAELVSAQTTRRWRWSRCTFVENGVCSAGHDSSVPRISEFYGIAIAMYYAEHGVPHFQALYAGRDASIAIDSLEILAGSLPDRAVRLVCEWAELHRAELAENWMRARDSQPLERIAPLP
jgi:Domain of unknown function (DUF4160)